MLGGRRWQGRQGSGTGGGAGEERRGGARGEEGEGGAAGVVR
jgi:hypothetical protein